MSTQLNTETSSECATPKVSFLCQVLSGLEGDLHCRKLHLSHKLVNVACTLEGEQTSVC